MTDKSNPYAKERQLKTEAIEAILVNLRKDTLDLIIRDLAEFGEGLLLAETRRMAEYWSKYER